MGKRTLVWGGVAIVVIVLTAACSDREEATFDRTNRSCERRTDCGSGEICMFRISDSCDAHGECAVPNRDGYGQMCGGVWDRFALPYRPQAIHPLSEPVAESQMCSCFGTGGPVGWFTTCFESGYAPVPVRPSTDDRACGDAGTD